MREISQELQQTVLDSPKISNVYFDASGRHWFNVFLLKTGKDDKDSPKLYGQGQYSHTQKIDSPFNIDNIHETISKGVPESLIVETISREDILAAKIKISGESIGVQVTNASDTDRMQIAAALGLTPDVMEMLGKIAKGELVVSAATAGGSPMVD